MMTSGCGVGVGGAIVGGIGVLVGGAVGSGGASVGIGVLVGAMVETGCHVGVGTSGWHASAVNAKAEIVRMVPIRAVVFGFKVKSD